MNEQDGDESVSQMITRYNSTDADSLSQILWERSAFYLFTYINEQYGSKNWDEFVELSNSNSYTVEKNLMTQYDKTIYSLAMPIHYRTKYPFNLPTISKVSQAGFINILFQNETSFDDQELLLPLLEKYSATILSEVIPDSNRQALFLEKLQIMNDGYINLYLISNQQSIDQARLRFATAYSRPDYFWGSQSYKYTNFIQSKYLNPISSITFLHELVHSVLAIDKRDIQLFEIDRNDDSAIANIISTFPHRNIMLEEGLCEYVSRKSSFWSDYPVFESIHTELNFFVEQNNFPLLSLEEMEMYYYGKRKKSFNYIEYGLVSAHSLVAYLLESYDIETVINLIYLEDISINAEVVLDLPWSEIMTNWENTVRMN